MDTAFTSLNVLVVEDNENLRESIVDVLTFRGYHVRGIECAEALSELNDFVRVDIAILDLNLPGEDGLSLAKRLRATDASLGIIMLTSRTQSSDRATGYAQGADIYLTKPASLNEIEQAIRALHRRLKSSTDDSTTTDCVHLTTRTLCRSDGTTVGLTSHETALLVAFTRAKQNTLETWQIAELLHMPINTINKSAIELHIVRLRKKFMVQAGHGVSAEQCGSPIQVIRGRGYQLCRPLVIQH